MNKKLSLKKTDYSLIFKNYNKKNRHWEYPYISYEDREKIMNFTRNVINKLILQLTKT